MFELQRKPLTNIFNFENDLENFFKLSNSDNFWKAYSDIIEKEDKYLLTVDMPGVAKEYVKIDLEDNTITVSAERKHEVNEEKENFIHKEKYYGKFKRSFKLPKTVDANNITAGLENGVLAISIPKKEAAQARQIQIN